MARPTLRKGMSGAAGTEVGEAILLWRKFLGKPELLPPPGTKTYDFGKATHDATMVYQDSVGLKADGVVGPLTWAKYDARIAAAPPAVQAKAAAAETQKAAAMAAAVSKPTPKPQPTGAPAPVATTPIEKVKEVRATVQNKIQETVDVLKTRSDAMPAWQRILSIGLIGLAGLVGYKAVKKA